MRCLPVLIALSLFAVSTQFAAAQGFGGQEFDGSRSWRPSDILQVQTDLTAGFGNFPAAQSAPEVHLLLGRHQPTYRFSLRSVASYADRNRPRMIFALPRRNGIQRVYALSQRGHIRRTARHHRRRH